MLGKPGVGKSDVYRLPFRSLAIVSFLSRGVTVMASITLPLALVNTSVSPPFELNLKLAYNPSFFSPHRFIIKYSLAFIIVSGNTHFILLLSSDNP